MDKDKDNDVIRKLLELSEKTGYNIFQQNGQRKFGPPPDWTGPPPPKGCEVFIGRLPREIFEDELVPIFSKAGKIYEMRLMMDFSGSNRGYAFVTYCTKAEAFKAVKDLNSYEIRAGRHIGVVKSVDNCRLFVGGIPKTKTREEILEELTQRVSGIVDVILYKNCFNKQISRGFAFVEFTSHRAAAMARRALVPGVKIWDHELMVDWAEPEPDVDDEQMKKVKVLYVRNFSVRTLADNIRSVFEKAVSKKIERVKKFYDYAFIHFYEREHAELAMAKLQNAEIDGSNIEIRWAKPVDRELYRIQKMSKGNAKFNSSLDWTQTLLLYKQHLEKKEYEKSSRDDGISSVCAGESISGSSTNWGTSFQNSAQPYTKDNYMVAPAKLDAMCKRYNWASPVYDYQKYLGPSGADVWVGRVSLPYVGLPLLTTPQRLGPLTARPCFSLQQAQVEAAEMALHYIKVLRGEAMQQATVTPTPIAMQQSTITPVQSVYQPVVQSLPTCAGLQYNYINSSIYPRTQPTIPVTVPVWRTV
ncbi:probable RNA-binding protein 46 [Achroia grisella]|uniref:probable RNA-binding protein 46 n=1 Tax=Achroia grisella TaxID=688607 RepID=UPI0027D349D2|nr:probable RNA-binding protein 46 [Achroia grisella]